MLVDFYRTITSRRFRSVFDRFNALTTSVQLDVSLKTNKAWELLRKHENECLLFLTTDWIPFVPRKTGFAFIPIKLHMKVLLKSNKWSWKWDLRNKFDALNKHVLKLYKIQYTTKLTLLSCVQGRRSKIGPINVMYAFETTKMLYCKRTYLSMNSIILLFHAVRVFRPRNNNKNLALSTPIKTEKTQICHFLPLS